MCQQFDDCNNGYMSESSDVDEFDIEEVHRDLIRILDTDTECTRCLQAVCTCETPLTPPRSPNRTPGYDFRIIARPARSQLTRNQNARQPSLSPWYTPTDQNPQPSTSVYPSWAGASTQNPSTVLGAGSRPRPLQLLSSPVPATIWNCCHDTEPEVNRASISLAGNVEEFFKAFSQRMQSGSSAYEQNWALLQHLKMIDKMQKKESENLSTTSRRPD